jgi:DNA-directed RNA polymerase II subunit RPB1
MFQPRYRIDKGLSIVWDYHDHLELPDYISRQGSCPLHIISILKSISDEDYRMLGFSPETNHPTSFILQRILVCPPCVRPSVQMMSGSHAQDDVTVKYADILKINHALRKYNRMGSPDHVKGKCRIFLREVFFCLS